MSLSWGHSHRQTSTLQGFHIAVLSRQSQRFIPHSLSQTSTIHHSSCLPGIHTSFPLRSFSQYQFTSSMAYPLSDYQHTCLHRPSWQSCHFPFSPHGQTIGKHLHQSFRSPLRTTQLSILLIPSKHLRLSICTTLIIDLSSFYIIVSLPYIGIGTSNDSYNTLAHSNCKSLPLTND